MKGKRLLTALGWQADLGRKEKAIYLTLAMSAVTLFILAMGLTLLSKGNHGLSVGIPGLIGLTAVLVLLIRRNYHGAKFVLMGTLYLSLFLPETLFLQLETQFQLFYLFIAPLSFVLFNLKNEKERGLIRFFHILSLLLLLWAVLLPPLLPLDLTVSAEKLLAILTGVILISVLYFSGLYYGKKLSNSQEVIKDLTEKDHLTNIHKRQLLFEKGETLFKIFQDRGESFTLLIFEIDDFKEINETHGHSCGDKILVEMSQVLSRVIRQDDLLYRYGGKAFALIFRCTNPNKNRIISQKIEEAVSKQAFFIPRSQSIHLSITMALIQMSSEYVDFSDMAKKADMTLEKLKKEGKGKTQIIEPAE
jgi:diguanylate cyclase (GGDEF)-like protein